MAFDAREYRNALKPPTFTDLDGNVYTGKILSHHQMAENQTKLAEVAALDENSQGMLARVEGVFREILGSMFPAPVVDKIMDLTPQGVQEAMADFLASQRRPRPARTLPLERTERPVGESAAPPTAMTAAGD